jgi:hypothetical protein
MTLQNSGAISLNNVNVELGRSGTATINMNETAVRTLAGKASGAISMSDFYGKSNFSPTTVTRTFGISATETVPAGATSVRIRVGGGGGAGGCTTALAENHGGGGGEGGFAERTIAVVGGNTLTYTVGAPTAGRTTAGSGANGDASSVTGTVSGGSVSMTANGGSGGGISIGGAGGTASGGTTNITGNAGTDGDQGGAGGSGASTQSGDGGTGGQAGFGSTGGFSGEIEFYYT